MQSEFQLGHGQAKVHISQSGKCDICKSILQGAKCDILGMIFHHANLQPEILLWVLKHAKWVIFLDANLYYKISNLHGIFTSGKLFQNMLFCIPFSWVQNLDKIQYFTSGKT